MKTLVKIFLFSAFFSLSVGQVTDGTELLKELQEKYKTIDDFTSSFRQSTKTGHVVTGEFYYKAKDKFRIELDSRTIVSDGETVWNYTPKNNKVIITTADDKVNSFSIEDYVFNFPEKCKVGEILNDDGNKILLLKPNSSELDFKEVKLMINESSLIDEIELTDLMDNVYRVELKNTKINQSLGDKYFTFEIPQGTQIIDLR
jgi:chaperone LolA